MNADLVVIEPRAALAPRADIGAVLEAWLEDLDGTTPDTRATYGRAAGRFVTWHESRGAGPVTAADVRAWLASVGGAPATRNVHLSAVRSFMRWAVREGHLDADPTAGMRSARVGSMHKRDAFTPAEVRAMLDVCEADTRPVGARDGAVLALMSYAALRTVEVVRADVGDVGTYQGRRVLWIHGKGAADTPTPGVLTDACWRAVRRWLDVRPGPADAGPLLTALGGPAGPGGGRLARRTVRAIIAGRMRQAGIEAGAGRRVTAHSLRHAAVTRVLTGGGTLRQAQALARHANLATTERYLHELDRYASAPEDLVTW